MKLDYVLKPALELNVYQNNTESLWKWIFLIFSFS